MAQASIREAVMDHGSRLGTDKQYIIYSVNAVICHLVLFKKQSGKIHMASR